MRTLTEEVAQHREEIRALRALVDDLSRALRSGGTGGSAGGASVVVPIHGHSGGGQGGPLNQSKAQNYIDVLVQSSAPGTPAAGYVRFYALASDKNLYQKDDAGSAADLSAGGGSSLQVQEEDGAPLDSAVTIIRVPNGGGLVDNGAGDVSLMYEIAGSIAAHAALTDPHTGYVLESLIDAVGDLIVGSADNAAGRLAKGADGQKLETRASETLDLKWVDDVVMLAFIIDGGGSAITTGQKGHIEVPEDLTVTGWTILGDQSGSIVCAIAKDTYANFPPTFTADEISGTEKPTLSSAQKNQDLSLSTWTTSLTAGDIIAYNVDSAATVTRVTVAIKCKRR